MYVCMCVSLLDMYELSTVTRTKTCTHTHTHTHIQLGQIQGAPSVQMQEVPPDWATGGEEEEDAASQNPDMRPGNRNRMGGEKRDHDAEFYEGEKDQDR